MTVNINDACEITLTKTGHKIFLEYKDSKYCLTNISNISNMGKFNPKNPPTVKLTLWEIMKIFGPYMYMGMEAPFLYNNIQIEN